MRSLVSRDRSRNNSNKYNCQEHGFFFYSFPFSQAESHYNKLELDNALGDAIRSTSQFVL